MLYIPRRIGEGIMVGDDVFIVLDNLNIHGINIGIEAPIEKEISRVNKKSCFELNSNKYNKERY